MHRIFWSRYCCQYTVCQPIGELHEGQDTQSFEGQDMECKVGLTRLEWAGSSRRSKSKSRMCAAPVHTAATATAAPTYKRCRALICVRGRGARNKECAIGGCCWILWGWVGGGGGADQARLLISPFSA
jgi:hypothetical protein